MKPVIFLDIDGVLNTLEQSIHPCGREAFSPEAVPALQEILKRTGAEIVISSSWREDIAGRIAPAFESNGLGGASRRIIGHTPILPEASPETRRADEIDAWLHQNPEYRRHFLVFDDDPCVRSAFPRRHILTHESIGLTSSHVELAVKILLRKPG